MLKQQADSVKGLYQGQDGPELRVVSPRGLIVLKGDEMKLWELIEIVHDRATVEASLGEDSASAKDLIKRMVNNGVIIDDEEPEEVNVPGQQLVKLGKRGHDLFDARALYLFLSDRCNMDCEYCYVPADMRLKGKGIMPFDMVKKTVDEFMEYAASRKKKEVELRFLGGEPFFDKKLLLKTLEYSTAKSEELGLKPMFVINTNGTYCDPKTVESLTPYAENLFMIVSLDGDEEAHNRHRPTPHGKPTYEMVTRGLSNLVEKGFKVCPHAVVTSANKDNIPDLMKSVKDKFGIKQLSYSFAHLPPNYKGDLRDLNTAEKMEVIRRTHELAEELAMELTGHWKFSVAQMVTNAPTLCEGGVSTICITSSGEMFACQRHVGDPSKSLGNIHNGLIGSLQKLQNARLSSWLNTMERSKGSAGCSNCAVAGDCSSDSVANSGKIDVTTLEFSAYQSGDKPESSGNSDDDFYNQLLKFYLENCSADQIKTTEFDKSINGMQVR